MCHEVQTEMPGIPEYRNQIFKMKLVVFVNRRFYEKICDSPTINEVNDFHFKLLIEIFLNSGISGYR